MTFGILKKHRVDLLIWLDRNVERAVSRETTGKGTEADPIPPWYVSVASQRAVWQGQTAQWRVIQRGMSDVITVDVNDEEIELMLRLKYA